MIRASSLLPGASTSPPPFRREAVRTSLSSLATGAVWEDEEYDRATLERPEDWFGAADVAIFPYWHSTLLADLTDRIASEWFVKGLPVESAEHTFEATRILLPPSLVAHVQRLEGGSG